MRSKKCRKFAKYISYISHSLKGKHFFFSFSFLHPYPQSLHKVALYGSIGLVITSWLKYIGVLIQNFALILLVQCFCALFHIFLSSIPSRIATVWFPIQEEYLTQAITIFANNLGLIINFLSLIVINNLDDMEILTTNLTDYILLIALLSTFNAIIMMFAFKQDEPEIPPSCIEALRRDKVIQNEDYDKRRFWKSLKMLMSNKNFIMLFLGFGLNIGVFNAFSTILNSIIVHYFPVSISCDKNILSVPKKCLTRDF